MKKLPNLSLSLQFTKFNDKILYAQVREILPRGFVTRCLRHALDVDAQITVRIVDEEEGRMLNQTYRHKNYATNVLTFDYAQVPCVIADLVLCAPVIVKEAHAQMKDFQAHCAHLLVHGALHAQGYDHENSEEKAHEMEQKEIFILQKLGFKNPY